MVTFFVSIWRETHQYQPKLANTNQKRTNTNEKLTQCITKKSSTPTTE